METNEPQVEAKLSSDCYSAGESLDGVCQQFATLIVCNLLLAIKYASGFIALRAKLPGPNEGD